jgi:hypothetical protein
MRGCAYSCLSFKNIGAIHITRWLELNKESRLLDDPSSHVRWYRGPRKSSLLIRRRMGHWCSSWCHLLIQPHLVFSCFILRLSSTQKTTVSRPSKCWKRPKQNIVNAGTKQRHHEEAETGQQFHQHSLDSVDYYDLGDVVNDLKKAVGTFVKWTTYLHSQIKFSYGPPGSNGRVVHVADTYDV